MSILETTIINLKAKGYRITRQREAIIGLVLHSKAPLSVKIIRKMLAEKQIKSDKATVYRNLELLTSENIINNISKDDPISKFESSKDHHHHLICTNCNRVEHIETETIEAEIRKQEKVLSGKYKFTFTGHSLNLYGHCGKCRN
jgi:Fe2+ or Zn2+ uptake regulation protein